MQWQLLAYLAAGGYHALTQTKANKFAHNMIMTLSLHSVTDHIATKPTEVQGKSPRRVDWQQCEQAATSAEQALGVHADANSWQTRDANDSRKSWLMCDEHEQMVLACFWTYLPLCQWLLACLQAAWRQVESPKAR